MAKRTEARLSGPECLQVIEKFGVKVVRSLIGGEITAPNHPRGDLFHEDSSIFTEVKMSGLGGGPIIVEDQLKRHREDTDYGRNYAFVLYESRDWNQKTRRYVNLPFRVGRRGGRKGLLRFLSRRIKFVYILDVEVVWGIYQAHLENGDLQEYQMQRGLKRYIKIPHKDLRVIRQDLGALCQFGVDPTGYVVKDELELARCGHFKIPVPVIRIFPSEDDSFDFERIEETA